jgi:hypothetical protein
MLRSFNQVPDFACAFCPLHLYRIVFVSLILSSSSGRSKPYYTRGKLVLQHCSTQDTTDRIWDKSWSVNIDAKLDE